MEGLKEVMKDRVWEFLDLLDKLIIKYLGWIYIGVTIVFCGILWALTSMLIILCE